MLTIGRIDRIDIPELDLFDIKAKVDTGAYGCTLHCHHIVIVKRGDKDVLSFKVLDPSHPEYEDKKFYAQNFKGKFVRSSSGEAEHRYTIKTKLVIFNKTRTVEFSLTDREKMKFPVLLGRQFLNKRFVVDVQLKDLSFNLKKQNENSSLIKKP